jgi:hypothetical protein
LEGLLELKRRSEVQSSAHFEQGGFAGRRSDHGETIPSFEWRGGLRAGELSLAWTAEGGCRYIVHFAPIISRQSFSTDQ